MPERGAGGRGGGWRGRWGRGRGAQRRRDGVTRSRVGGGPRASGGGRLARPDPGARPRSRRHSGRRRGVRSPAPPPGRPFPGGGPSEGARAVNRVTGWRPLPGPPPVPPGRAAALGCARPAAPAPRPLCFCFAGARVQRARVASRAGAGGGEAAPWGAVTHEPRGPGSRGGRRAGQGRGGVRPGQTPVACRARAARVGCVGARPRGAEGLPPAALPVRGPRV